MLIDVASMRRIGKSASRAVGTTRHDGERARPGLRGGRLGGGIVGGG